MGQEMWALSPWGAAGVTEVCLQRWYRGILHWSATGFDSLQCRQCNPMKVFFPAQAFWYPSWGLVQSALFNTGVVCLSAVSCPVQPSSCATGCETRVAQPDSPCCPVRSTVTAPPMQIYLQNKDFKRHFAALVFFFFFWTLNDESAVISFTYFF